MWERHGTSWNVHVLNPNSYDSQAGRQWTSAEALGVFLLRRSSQELWESSEFVQVLVEDFLLLREEHVNLLGNSRDSEHSDSCVKDQVILILSYV